MSSHKFLNLTLLVVVVASLFLGGGGQVLAQGEGPKDGKGPTYPHQLHRPVTQADREAAAANQKAAREAAAAPAAPTAVAAAPAQGGVPDYFGGLYPNWAWSQPIPKFVESLPSLAIAKGSLCANIGYTGGLAADCYEIHLEQFQVQMMPAPLPMTTVRGYVEYVNGVRQTPSYLGPTIVASRDKPVRIKFVNGLTPSTDGDLFIPVDTTYMGAGAGPAAMMGTDCSAVSASASPTGCYSTNRGTLHLHGGTTPWISDGTPHQWTTPATDLSSYPKGVSVYNVPDMPNPGKPANPDPGAGTLTFFYSNQQSARLMFYHDHSYGITRLNVYAGEAAGYLLTDQFEQDLINGTNVSGAFATPVKVLPDVGIPLVIQDKTFVDTTPAVDPVTLATRPAVLTTDPTWNWGTGAATGGIRPPVAGDLWYPHVYMPNQNPYDITGANAMGRWDYGPWFWPPFTGIQHGAQPNPYCLPTPPLPGSTEANPGPYSCTNGEPPFIPGTPPNHSVVAGTTTPAAPDAWNSPSGTPESFMDTPVVNGKAYPVLHVAPTLTRFRILNAANDRFMNLQLYQASSATSAVVGSITVVTPGAGYTTSPVMSITGVSANGTGAVPGLATLGTVGGFAGAITGINLKALGSGYLPTDVLTVNIPPPPCTPVTAGTACAQAVAHVNIWTNPTEVGTVPFNSTQNTVTPFPSWWYTSGIPFSLDDRDGGVPDPRLRGPALIQIGTEGGFLPAPAVIPNQPINFDYNRKSITVLNILQHALFLGPAERADVLADFTNFQGKTLILYNDSTAPTPANETRVDYYTGDPDQTSTGGYGTTLPGTGPNIRTIMQIVVDQPVPATAVNTGVPSSTAPVDDYNATWVNGTLAPAVAKAFGASQDTIIQPQAGYAAAYPTSVMPTGVAQYVRIQDTQHTFTPIGSSIAVTATLQPKAIQELFTNDFGRMNALLGNEVPNTTGLNQTTIIQSYVDPPVEQVTPSDTKFVKVAANGTLADGTQLWKITHNGVDTHVIHTHMFVMQLVNRVGWDGMIKPPDANELGWKDTYRMNPLEDVIVAIRPIKLTNLPFKLPNSIRPMDVTTPVGTSNPANTVGFTQVDPAGNPMTPLITNQLVNYGWEYVYHCHILGHEENDMMRPVAAAIPPEDPTNLVAVTSGNGTKKVITLTWTDNSLNSTGFTLQRDTVSTFNSANLVTVPLGKVTTYTDPIGNTSTVFYYRVRANNTVGSTAASNFTASVGGAYPVLTASSNWTVSVPANPPPAPAAPTNLVATLGGTLAAPQILLTFTDNATNETGFYLVRSVNGGAYAPLATLPPRTNTGSVSYTDATVVLGNTYQYGVAAFGAPPFNLVSAYTYSGSVGVSIPTLPSLLTISTVRQGTNNNVTLTWTASQYQTSYTIQWSTNNFATVLGTRTGIAANATSTAISVPRGTVPPGTRYYFRIQAVNVLGASQWSNVLSIVTQ